MVPQSLMDTVSRSRPPTGRLYLRYSGLVAWDADGQSLPAQMVLEGQTVRWVVQDQGARYPVTIDPWVQQVKLTATDGAEQDFFGSSVAVSGETAVIGAPDAAINGNANQGAAYVFVRSGDKLGLAGQTDSQRRLGEWLVRRQRGDRRRYGGGQRDPCYQSGGVCVCAQRNKLDSAG